MTGLAAKPLEPTRDMIEAGAQRLVRWERDDHKWPDDWSALHVAAARNEAERCWRLMWLAATTPPEAAPREPAAWLIQYSGQRALCLHNCVGDYRDFDANATSTPLYAAPPSEGVQRALYTSEEVDEAMRVLRGKRGSTALLREALDEMERVLRDFGSLDAL